MSVGQVLAATLPPWARPGHPVLRYMLRGIRHQSALWRWMARGLAAGVATILLGLSYSTYRQGTPILVSNDVTSGLYQVLYFPLLVVQFIVVVAALVATSRALLDEQQRGTWEAIQITSYGAGLALRARWAAAFYRMRGALLVLLAARVVFVGRMIAGLADYDGYRLDLYVDGITPAVSLEVAGLALAALMTAALLQPFALIGLNAALGLFIATLSPRRYYVVLMQGMILMLAFVLFGLALLVDVFGQITARYPPAGVSWRETLFVAVAGDQGLHLLDLDTLLVLWGEAKYGVWVGVALLGMVLVQVLLAEGLLRWAEWRAARPARK
jgi:hypothetical protein